MQISIKKKIGKETYTFLVSGENLYELVMESQKLSFGNVDECGLCHKDNLILNARFAQKKYKYVEVKCLSCKGSLTFGSKMEDPNTYYLRKNEEKKYDWKAFDGEKDVHE